MGFDTPSPNKKQTLGESQKKQKKIDVIGQKLAAMGPN